MTNQLILNLLEERLSGRMGWIIGWKTLKEWLGPFCGGRFSCWPWKNEQLCYEMPMHCHIAGDWEQPLAVSQQENRPQLYRHEEMNSANNSKGAFPREAFAETSALAHTLPVAWWETKAENLEKPHPYCWLLGAELMFWAKSVGKFLMQQLKANRLSKIKNLSHLRPSSMISHIY